MTVFKFSDTSSLNSDFITFHDQVFSKQPFMVFVVAPEWCGHCQRMEKDLNDFLEQEANSSANIVYFSDVAYNHLVSSHRDNKITMTLESVMNGYPTIAAFEPTKEAAMSIHEFPSDKARDKAAFEQFKKQHLKVKANLKASLQKETKPKTKKTK
jgi:thiol-disulfide isomerase/thioredoxin